MKKSLAGMLLASSWFVLSTVNAEAFSDEMTVSNLEELVQAF